MPEAGEHMSAAIAKRDAYFAFWAANKPCDKADENHPAD
jgi:hypothetical protein